MDGVSPEKVLSLQTAPRWGGGRHKGEEIFGKKNPQKLFPLPGRGIELGFLPREQGLTQRDFLERGPQIFFEMI